MVNNFLNGGAAISVLARQQNAELLVIDVGVNGDFEPQPGLHGAKIACGTSNFAQQQAMTEGQLTQAVDLGLELAQAADEAGHQLIAVGEMGIGNTTSASAIAAVLTGRAVDEVTGRGTGLDEPGRHKKIDVIRRSLYLHFADREPDPLELLQTVGGLEIAAMTGFILGLASHQRAIVCDGFISTAAAGLAFAICPEVKHFLYAGHCSEEPGHQHLLHSIGLQPILSLGMRLGEGTGAVLAMPIIEAALHLYSEMATFASAGVSKAETSA
jgi:nicotinate-nucleotide--dimethylbenzimidazole phosphoribosyltransferase